MADKTGIEWTDATWNPVTGCSHVSEGCRFCYAEELSLRRGWSKLPWTAQNAADKKPHRLDQPLRWQRPRRVFVNSMSDLFHERIDFHYIDKVFAVMALAERHTFQVLTKRPERMLEYFDSLRGESALGRAYQACEFADALNRYKGDVSERVKLIPQGLPNVWLGTSVEEQRWVDSRIMALCQVPAVIRFLSCEPLLGPLNLAGYLDGTWWNEEGSETDSRVHWVIVGGESGPHYRAMEPDWARSIRDQCLGDRVPFFFKQWGGRTPKAGGNLLDGQTWQQFPERAA